MEGERSLDIRDERKNELRHNDAHDDGKQRPSAKVHDEEERQDTDSDQSRQPPPDPH